MIVCFSAVGGQWWAPAAELLSPRVAADSAPNPMPSESTSTTTTEAPHCALGALARLIWMTAGNIALVVLVLGIAIGPPWSFTWRDWAFLAAALGMLLVRYVDITRLGGRTAEGDPATMRDFWSWAAVVVVVCAVLWGLGHSFAL